MYRFLSTVVAVCLSLTAVSSQTYCPECPYLGGNDPQAILDYFKSLPYPHLLTNYHDAANVAALKAKATAGDARAATLWAAISNKSNLNIPYRVENAAFYYSLMGGMTATETKAFGDIVRAYNPEAHAVGDWNYPENLKSALTAYDAIGATAELSAAEKTTFQTDMLVQIAGMETRTTAPGQSGNINEYSGAVLGLCALMFPDHADAYSWLDRSLKFMQMSYHELTNEACIAEGPSYQLGTVAGAPATLMLTLEEHGFTVVDRQDNFLEEMWTWMVKTQRPDGRCVQTEDCWTNNTPGSIWPAKYITSDTERRRALQWYLNKINATGYSPKNYITWDTGLNSTAAPKWNPTQFFPTSSCAIFRTGFTGGETWLYLLGDRMPFNFSYGGMGGWTHNKHHGHWDATSLTLYAHGGYLLTESSRFAGLYSKYHNLIMVDNNESEPSWAISSDSKYTTLSRTIATDFFDCADIGINYVNTDFVRSVLFCKQFAGNEYFVLVDDVEAADATSHQYHLLFHNRNGDITGSGTKMWTTATDTALAEIHFVEPDLVTVVKETEDVGYTDTRIRARYDGQSFQFVTILYPRSTSMSAPTVAELNGSYYHGGSVTSGSTVDIILSQKGNQAETVGTVRSDGSQTVVRTVSGTPSMYYLKDGTVLEKSGTTLISADVAIAQAVLQYASNIRITGTLVLDRAANITFKSADGSVSSWMYLDAGTYDNFDFTLATGGKITGTVTDDDLGTAIPNVKVEAVQTSETSYCYTNAAGNYTFDWVRPGGTTVRFSRAGYTTAQTTGQTVTAGNTLTVNKVLSITTAAPQVLNAAVLTTTNTSAVIRIQSDKPCYNQVAYGTSTSYGSNTTKTLTYAEVDTVSISGLTGGQVYHYQVTLTDYDGRTGSSADLTFAPVGDFSDDFEDGDYAPKWETASSYWSETGGVLSKTSSGNFVYEPKRLGDLILAKNVLYSSFTLTGKVQSTRSSDKRDVCVAFNYEDDTHYYYAQFSMTSDADYNGIFKVDGADKVKIGTAGSATLNADTWADIKIVRDLKTGAIEAYCDDMTEPCFQAYDSDFGLGRIALGSERSTVSYDDFLIRPVAETGIRVEPAYLLNGPVRITCGNPVAAGSPVTFRVYAVSSGQVAVSLYDGTGNRLYHGIHASTDRIAVDSRNLPGGVLYYAVETAMGIKTGKTVIIK